MRYLILSDIHANIEALEAVLASAAGAWDRVLVLGDLVGYGAAPNAVVDRVRELAPQVVIRGNHDKASCGLDDGASFNYAARLAAEWTGSQLTDGNREYLRALAHGPIEVNGGLEVCHGAPFDEDYYIFDALDAQRAFEAARRRILVFGHTHLPVVFMTTQSGLAADSPEGELPVQLDPGTAYLLNPGSVGQPRDGDPRAAFAIYDSEGRFVFRRAIYDVAGAQRRISEAGLPQNLANRLAAGR